jgi:hypothetical protein
MTARFAKRLMQDSLYPKIAKIRREINYCIENAAKEGRRYTYFDRYELNSDIIGGLENDGFTVDSNTYPENIKISW